MAQISKSGPEDEDEGGSPQQVAEPGRAVPQPPRHNLPLRTAPVVGRKREMQAIAQAFEKLGRAGRPGRVEIVGRSGIGASAVAMELARRAGSRMGGGAWVLDATLGPDLAWADVAAARGRGTVRNLAQAVREEKEEVASGPQAILVIDGVRDADHMMSCLPLDSRTKPFVFVVAEKPTGATDDVVEVSDVPPHAPRRVCQAMLQGVQNAPPVPAVRTADGLGLTASLSARAAMILAGRAGPLLVQDVRNAALRLVPLVAGTAACLELLLLSSVLHPSRISVDSLFAGVAAVRHGRGPAPSGQEIGQSITVLARAGLLDPVDDRRLSMHPLVQEQVRSMAKSEEDLSVARQAAAAGLCEEAEASITESGVEIALCGLHQLRFLEPQLAGAPRDAVAAARGKLEKALGIAG